MAREIRGVHQRPATVKTGVGVAQIRRRVGIRVLDQPPKRPQQIAHRLVDHHAALFGRISQTAEIGVQQFGLLFGVHLCLN